MDNVLSTIKNAQSTLSLKLYIIAANDIKDTNNDYSKIF